MIDIVSVTTDIGVFDSQTAKAANVLSIQLGHLVYAPDMGIDLRYFLSEEFRFQDESFKAYLIQRLADHAINVASIVDTVEALHKQLTINITPAETGGGLVAR